MFVALSIEINVSKLIYGYKTAELDELSYYNKVKVKRLKQAKYVAISIKIYVNKCIYGYKTA